MQNPFVIFGTSGLSSISIENIIDRLNEFNLIAIDTAPNYVSAEIAIGNKIHQLINAGAKRENIFIQTKIDWQDIIKDGIPTAINNSLKRLKVDYIDSLLLHWPFPSIFVKAYKQMEKIYKDGIAKQIGVCNFKLRHFEMLLNGNISVKPMINQIEIHPFNICSDIVKWCNEQEIQIQAYTPLLKMLPKVSENPTLCTLAKKYGVSIPQIIYAWNSYRNIVPVTKTSNSKRIDDILKAFDLNIADEDIEQISALNEDYKFMLESWGCPGY